MKRRLVTFVLVLTMATLIFSACAAKTDNTTATTTSSASTSASTAPATTPADPPVELKMISTAFGPVPQDLQKVVDEINKIAIAKTNTKIDLLPISISAYTEQCRLMLSARERLDLFLTGTLSRFDYTGQVARGQLVALDDYIEKYGQDIKAVLGKYLNASRYKGKLYGLAMMRDLGASKASIIFSDELVAKYKMDLSSIKTYTDAEPFFEIIKKNEPTVIPFSTARDPQIVQALLGYDLLGTSWGAVLADPTKPIVSCMYFEKELYDMCKVLHSWYDKGYMVSDIASSTVYAVELLKAGRVFSFQAASKPNEAFQYETQAGKKLTLIQVGKQAYASTDSTLRFLWAIPTQSKNPDAAMKFLNLMYGDEKVVNLFQWGIEGVHYVKNPDGTIKYPEGKDANNVGYQLNANWLWGDQLKQYIWEGTPLTFVEDMKKYNDAPASVGMGFIFDPEPVKTELAGIMNLISQYELTIQSGQGDPDKVLPEFQSKLKAASIDKCIAEVQKQFDAWRAANNK